MSNLSKLADELDKAAETVDEDMTPYLGHEKTAIAAIEKIKDIAWKMRNLK
jgi:hypothetical protein